MAFAVTTRKQRETIKRFYDRGHFDSVQFNRDYQNYRAYRKTAQPTFGCDGAVVIPWFGSFVCVEADGYAHS